MAKIKSGQLAEQDAHQLAIIRLVVNLAHMYVPIYLILFKFARISSCLTFILNAEICSRD